MLNAASCQFLVNPHRLSVLLFLSCLDDLLVLHDFLVELDLCDGRITSSSAPPEYLHRSLDASGLADCSFLLYCVSPRNSPRTSPCLDRSPLVCLACCWLCSCLASCWRCSSRFFSSFLSFSTLSAALRAHRRFDVLLAVLALVLLLHLLFTTGSSAVVMSRMLTTCSMAVVRSVSLSHHWLLGSGSVSDPPQRDFVVGYIFLDASPAPPTPLLSIAPFVIVGSRLVLGLLGRAVYNNVLC